MGVLFDVYIFLAWFGSWSTASGFGAFVICLMWTGLMIFSVAASYAGGWLSIIMTFLSLGTKLLLAPAIAFGCWLAYFFGLGDWATNLWPSFFPKGGYFFSEASASGIEWLIFIVWAVLRGLSARFMAKLATK